MIAAIVAAVSPISIFRFTSGVEGFCAPAGAGVSGKFAFFTGDSPLGVLDGGSWVAEATKATGFTRLAGAVCIAATGWGLLTGAFWRPIE